MDDDVDAAPAVELALVGPAAPAAPSSEASALVASGKSGAVVLAICQFAHTLVKAELQLARQFRSRPERLIVTATLARWSHKQSKVPDPMFFTSQPSLSRAFLKADKEHWGKSLTDSESDPRASAPMALATTTTERVEKRI